MASLSSNMILADRDSNTQLSPQKSSVHQSKGLEKPLKTSSSGSTLQRKMLESRLQNGGATENTSSNESTGKYISPSDQILSPASQKLNAFKSKQALKKTRPTTLFKAHTEHKSSSSLSTNGLMFADIPSK